jgi:2-polyprenyl-3-methyl-5-hydroxy-6-metoxy-1,4-benzoquinol methylase
MRGGFIQERNTVVTAANFRISPLLAEQGREEDLSYAPAPWVLKKCLETDIIFLANPPAYEELSETYAYEVTFKKESEARRQAEPIRYAFSTMLKRFRAKVLKRNKVLGMLHTLIAASPSQQINVLDVGCGWGELLQVLMTSLPERLRGRVAPHGVEISLALSRLSDEKLRPLGGRCVHASAQDGVLRFDEDYFDVIIMASYLEHEASPLAVLENCRKRLKENGTIIVKVPNFACFNRMIRGPKWSGFRWPDHVNYFTPATLRAIADLAGLEVVRMTALDTSPLSDNMYALLRSRKGPNGAKS